MSRVIDEHRLYLRDTNRVSAYERALREIVKPGDVVVDLASGTGILGLLACRAGASRVYAIEETAIAGLAREVARANGFGDKVTSVRGYSKHVTLPERGDVVVCDQIGGFGLEAGILELAAEVREKFLKPAGTFIPSRIDLVIAGVEHRRLSGRVRFWSRRTAGLDWSPALEIAANTGYPARLRPEHLLTPPATVATLGLLIGPPTPLRVSGTVQVSRTGVLHGIGGWFEARLSPHVTMTNSPLSDERIFRRPIFFPIADGVPVEAGTTVDVSMRILPAETLYAWEVCINLPSGPAIFRHSTLRGMLLAREDLERSNPSYKVALTPAGAARLTVLQLCDGSHALADIERLVFDAHRQFFAAPSEAAVFVAEVVSRYGR